MICRSPTTDLGTVGEGLENSTVEDRSDSADASHSQKQDDDSIPDLAVVSPELTIDMSNFVVDASASIDMPDANALAVHNDDSVAAMI